MASQTVPASFLTALADAEAAARAAGVFASVERQADRLHCVDARQPEAAYRVGLDDGSPWVLWVAADRYLSQSIEADLMWTGDDLAELIDEELAEQGYAGPKVPKPEHFRDPDKLFTFRTPIPGDIASIDGKTLARFLLAYQAAFAELGDMKGDEDE